MASLFAALDIARRTQSYKRCLRLSAGIRHRPLVSAPASVRPLKNRGGFDCLVNDDLN
jgi:hypothetical protein